MLDAVFQHGSVESFAVLISHGTVHGNTVAGVDWVRLLQCGPGHKWGRVSPPPDTYQALRAKNSIEYE